MASRSPQRYQIGEAVGNLLNQREGRVVAADKDRQFAFLEMDDGGMGSLTIRGPAVGERVEKQVAEVTFFDVDGLWDLATSSVDQFDDLFELDVFKGDFSPLIEIPQTFN